MSLAYPENFESDPYFNAEEAIEAAVVLYSLPNPEAATALPEVVPEPDLESIRTAIVRLHAETATREAVDSITAATAPVQPAEANIALPVLEREPVRSFKPRDVRMEDIPTLVDIDMRTFRNVYKHYGKSDEVLKQELLVKFTDRINLVGKDWVQVLEGDDGNLYGFMMNCPTSKPPEDFTSWEDTTDNGTLETTFDPDGEYLYVVSLSVLPEATKVDAQDMLFMATIGKLVAAGTTQAYFESRLPNFKRWVKSYCRENEYEFDALTDEDKDSLASKYYQLKTNIDGKEVALDPLLRLYEGVGCKFEKVVPDAYQDDLSMNYGVVCVFDNPMPGILQKSRLASKACGKAIGMLSKYQRIAEKVF